MEDHVIYKKENLYTLDVDIDVLRFYKSTGWPAHITL